MIAMWWGHFMWFWGLTNGSEWPYLLWSGSGSDVVRLALLAGLIKGLHQQVKHHKELKDMHERHHREMMNTQYKPGGPI